MQGPLLVCLALASARAGELEALVRDSAGKPLADAVVFVDETPAAPPAPPAEPAVMDQVGQEFVPHVLPVVAGTRLRFPNKDKVHHQIFSFSPAKKFELPLYKDEPPPLLLDKTGAIKLGCNIHDWMRAYVLVLATPHFAKTGADGIARLKDLPEGTRKLAVWHERVKGGTDAARATAEVGANITRVTLTPKLGPPVRKPNRPLASEY